MSKKLFSPINISQVKGIKKGNYITPYFFMVDGIPDSSDFFCYPCKLNGGGVVLCLNGQCEISLDLINYTIKPDDLLYIVPNSIVQSSNKSIDFQGYIIAATPSFLSGGELKATMSQILLIKENPLLSLTKQEKELIFDIFSLLWKYVKREDHPYRKEIAQNLLTNLYYEICVIYQKQKTKEYLKPSHNELIFKRFIELVKVDYKTKRNVEYYANKLNLTPKYLSTVIKRLSNKTVKEWLSKAIIMEAQYHLKACNMSIWQISEDLNFPNASFFSQYFKQHTGMTPTEFQKS